MEKIYIPKNLDECITWLDEHCEGIQEYAKTKSEDDFVVTAHRNIGRQIRNNWGLWNGQTDLRFYFNELKLEHADDMSGLIFTAYYRKKNNKPLEIEKEIKKYQDHWKTYGR